MKAVLVAGGTGALGSAVVQELLDAGHPVTCTWIVDAERERAEKELGGNASFSLVKADLFDVASTDDAVNAVEDLGAVVNLVGGYAGGTPAHQMDVEDFERMFKLNVRPAFLLAKAAMPRLVEAGGGAFVGVSARAAVQPFAGSSGYIAAKAALLAFIKALDKDYRAEGVRCNAVLPSVIDTPANRRDQPDADYSRWVSPADIARVIRFLVADDAEPISGAGIPVYGRA